LLVVLTCWLWRGGKAAPAPAATRTPRARRDPTPFAGLTHKPPCALCEHEAAHPQAPLPYDPTPCPRPTGVPARWTPRGTFVPIRAVGIVAGWGWGTCAPEAIPAVASGDNASVPRARAIFHIPPNYVVEPRPPS